MRNRNILAIGTAVLLGGAALGTAAFADGPSRRGHHEGMGGPHGMAGGPPGMALLGPISGRGPAAMFEALDTDKNGSVTRAEIEARRAERLDTFDGNDDGALVLDEFTVLWAEQTRPMMVRAFQRHDVDGDGRVTAEELSDGIEKMVTLVDRDGDGAVTMQELRDAGPGQRGDRGRRGPRGDGTPDAPPPPPPAN